MILKDVLGRELPMFVETTLNVTQKMYDPYSHAGTKNIDFGGVDGGRDLVYAPCKIIVKKVKQLDYGEVIVWSADKVLWADGTFDYFSMRLLHCENVSHLTVGQVIEQGTHFYTEGGQGPNGPTTYGKHIHLGVARGQTTTVLHIGGWELANSVAPYDVFWVNGVTIKNGAGYPWKTYTAPAFASMKDVANMAFKSGPDNIWIRQQPSTDYPKVGLLPKLTQVDITQVSTAKVNGYDWVKVTYGELVGYCAVVEGSEVIAVLTPIQILEKALQEANAKIKEQEALIALQKTRIASLEAEIASYVKVEKVLYEKV